MSRAALAALVADPFFAEALFDRLPDVVLFVKNTACEYVVVNRTLAARCGLRDKSALLGRTAADVFPAPLGTVYAEQDRQVIVSGAEIRDRLELHLYPGGARGWCLTYKMPVLGAGGRIVGMAGLSRDLHRPDESRAGFRGIAAAVEYLREHLAEGIRVADLAKVAGMPVERFSRLVRRVFQLTPGQLVVKTRLEAATDLLVDTSTSIAEVAHACGYTDHSAFSRQFRAATGLTPTEFREAIPKNRRHGAAR